MLMVTGFMAGVALGQQLVGMSKSKKTQTFANTNQRLQSAKIAAYKRMQARQKQLAMVNSQKVLSEMPVTTTEQLLHAVLDGFDTVLRKSDTP